MLGALGGALVDAGAGDRAGELGAEDAVVGVDVAGELGCDDRCRRRPCRRACRSRPRPASASIRIGFAWTRPASARASTSSSATGRSIGSRSRNSSSGVISGARSTSSCVGDLLEQVVAADQVLGAVVAERADDLLDLLAHRLEEAGAALGGGVDGLRGELLQAVLLGLLGRSRSGWRCRRGRCRAGSRGRSCSRARPSPGCRRRPGWPPCSAA